MREKLDLTDDYARKYPLTFADDPQARKDAERRYQQAWEVAEKAADLLKKKYGAKKVVVFGSLAHRPWFTPWSDIDLAAWGIPAERFFAAVGAVTGLSPDFKIDLVDPVDCRDSLRKAIEDEGIEI